MIAQFLQITTLATSKFSVVQQQQKSEPDLGGHGPWRPVGGELSHFTLGSLIQLSNGDLKRVENLTREDFIRSAKNSSDLKIDESCVIGMDPVPERGSIILNFAVGKDKVQVRKSILNNCQFLSFFKDKTAPSGGDNV